MALLSTTTLRTDYLPDVQASDSDALAVLGRALDRAETAVARYLGYPGQTPSLGSAAYTFRLSGLEIDPQRLVVPIVPVTAITSVHQDLQRAFASDTEVSASDYEQVDALGATYLDLLPTATSAAAWYTGHRTIRVICTAGYANEAAIPDDIADAIYRMVASWFLRIRNREKTSSGAGNQTYSLRELAHIPPDAAAILDAYTLSGKLGAA